MVFGLLGGLAAWGLLAFGIPAPLALLAAFAVFATVYLVWPK